jgi:hypothetical protein
MRVILSLTLFLALFLYGCTSKQDDLDQAQLFVRATEISRQMEQNAMIYRSKLPVVQSFATEPRLTIPLHLVNYDLGEPNIVQFNISIPYDDESKKKYAGLSYTTLWLLNDSLVQNYNVSSIYLSSINATRLANNSEGQDILSFSFGISDAKVKINDAVAKINSKYYDCYQISRTEIDCYVPASINPVSVELTVVFLDENQCRGNKCVENYAVLPVVWEKGNETRS